MKEIGPDGEETDDLKRLVLLDDEFTCHFCGRIVNLDDMVISYLGIPRQKGEPDPSNMVTSCRECAKEGIRNPVVGEERRRLLSALRHLKHERGSDGDRSVVEDLEKKCSLLIGKLRELNEENGRLMREMDKKTSLAIAYRKKLERATRDYENLKRRQAYDIDLKVRSQIEDLVLVMIDTLDNLDRAVLEAKHSPDRGSLLPFIDGLELIRKKMISSLRAKGIERVDPVGQPFDPSYHEAIETVRDVSKYEGTIIEVESPGYVLEDRIIRPAKVITTTGGRRAPKEVIRKLSGVRGGAPDEEEWFPGDPWDQLARDLEEEFEMEEDQEEYVVVIGKKRD